MSRRIPILIAGTIVVLMTVTGVLAKVQDDEQASQPAPPKPSPKLVQQNELLIKQAMQKQAAQKQGIANPPQQQAPKAPQTTQASPKPTATPTAKPTKPIPAMPPPSIPIPQLSQTNITLRVAIGQNLKSVPISGSTALNVTDLNNYLVDKIPAGTGIIFEAGLRWKDKQSQQPLWLKGDPNGVILVGERWYRGDVLLMPDGDGILVVNYVDLERYLYSVVGAEMPNIWQMEALRAQAVAARSYALIQKQRPASDWYDLGNTERHQVYHGVNVETDRSQQAVQSTLGLVVSQSGGIVEAMYASTDEMVATAHRDYESMSQTGAQELALRGYDFTQIVQHYYEGKTIGVLQVN
jgi:hypothetical protein